MCSAEGVQQLRKAEAVLHNKGCARRLVEKRHRSRRSSLETLCAFPLSLTPRLKHVFLTPAPPAGWAEQDFPFQGHREGQGNPKPRQTGASFACRRHDPTGLPQAPSLFVYSLL